MRDNINNNKRNWFIGAGMFAVLLLIALRFVLYYIKSDGFSGISILLPLFAIAVLAFAFLTSLCFSLWVYQDCKKRNDDAILWAVIVFITTPFIGLLVYFLRRFEIKQTCTSCGHKISLKANFCEKCGSHITPKQANTIMKKQQTHHLKYIVAGIICMVLLLTCLTGFIASAAIKGNVNTSISSDEKVWNMGSISMNSNTYLNGLWKLDFKSASDGFVTQENMKIADNDTDMLYADISNATVPEGSILVLWLVQGDTSKSIDVTDLSEPLEYSLSEFSNGTLRVRLQINGVKNCTSEIYIR